MESSGGGGYGDPLGRAHGAIAKDLREGFITKEKAEVRYGVTLKGETIDPEKTNQRREKKQKERNFFKVQGWKGEEYRGTKRLCFLSSGTMKNLGLKEGDLVELVNPRAAPLRVWVAGLGVEDKGEIYLGSPGLEILGVKEGDPVELRPIRA
jgi:hypothetical protein